MHLFLLPSNHHKKSDCNLARFALMYLLMLLRHWEETLLVTCHALNVANDQWTFLLLVLFIISTWRNQSWDKQNLNNQKSDRFVSSFFLSKCFFKYAKQALPTVSSKWQIRSRGYFLNLLVYFELFDLLSLCDHSVEKQGQDYCRSIQSLPISIHWQRRGRGCGCGRPLVVIMTWGPLQACNITATVQMYATIGPQCLVKERGISF